jgi:hypothetical protein
VSLVVYAFDSDRRLGILRIEQLENGPDVTDLRRPHRSAGSQVVPVVSNQPDDPDNVVQLEASRLGRAHGDLLMTVN